LGHSCRIWLTAVYFLLLFIERSAFSFFLPQMKPPSGEIINLMMDLAQHPFLLAIWLRPVVWIGVALFEEIVRVFFLNCLWKLANNKSWEIASIILVSAIAGVSHLYQGMFGIVSIGIQGLVMGLFYYKFRRILPLIISHVFYDSFQIIMFIIQVS
jgi:membrane protease YdiL (CAAX protease family)